MAIDFPNSPTLNQVFTAGGQSWVWDGTKWNSMSSGFSDAPSDGTTYGRKNAAWSSVDAMLAPVTQEGSGNTGRNLLHNPLFTVQQRGAGPFTANGALPADRWQMYISGSGTASISPLALADSDRAAIGDEAATYQLHSVFTGTSGAADYTVVLQRTEDVRRLANKTITVSFWANASVALKLGVSVDQFYGTGGSPSASTFNNGQAVSIPGLAWARYSLTFTLASLAGKTLGTNNDHNTQLLFWLSSGSTNNPRTGNIGVQSGTINIWGVQLEVGNVMTALSKRDPQQELALCQRFYQVAGIIWTGYGINTGEILASSMLPVQMRAAPTAALTSNSNANVGTITAAVTGSGGTGGALLYIHGVATATGTIYLNQNCTLSADL